MPGNLFLHATSNRPGALGIIHLRGGEDFLAGRIDAALGGKSPLVSGELRHGWLSGPDGEKLDEVLLACPGTERRILMTHGGRAVREAVGRFLRASGFEEAEAPFADDCLDPLLAAAVTESQAAFILGAGMEGRTPAILSDPILRTHRVLLAGPPNAGKSSLLNSLSGYDRAFVHAEAGATRDVVDELIDLGGYAAMLGDLPGFIPDGSGFDAMAWRKAAARLREADAVFFVVDGSSAWDAAVDSAARAVRAAMRPGIPVLVILNKSDLPRAVEGAPWEKHFPDAIVADVCSLPDGNARETLDGIFAASIVSRRSDGPVSSSFPEAASSR